VRGGGEEWKRAGCLSELVEIEDIEDGLETAYIQEFIHEPAGRRKRHLESPRHN
jgi:hypothetical protein